MKTTHGKGRFWQRVLLASLVCTAAICVWHGGAGTCSAQGRLGDTNGDGLVNIDDFNNVRNNLDGTMFGDTNGDGVTDIDDLNNVRDDYGVSAGRELPNSGGAGLAATIQVSPVVSEIFLDDFMSPATWQPDGANGARIDPSQGMVVAKIDFLMEIQLTPQPGALGFGNVDFDVITSGDVTTDILPFWIADSPTVNHDGDDVTSEVLRWSDNADFGTSGDLIAVVVGVAPDSFGPVGVDPRRTLGQAGLEFMGNVFATIDTGTLGNHGFVEAGTVAFSTYDETGQLARNNGRMSGGAVSLRVVPEPTSGLLCGLASLGCVSFMTLSRPRNTPARAISFKRHFSATQEPHK